VRYRPQHEAKNYQKTVELTFRIERALADKINKEVFGSAAIIAAGSTFTRDTKIANTSNHYRVAQAVLPVLTAAALQPDELARIDQLFDRVHSAMG
jgi:hypothetical protein